MSDVLIIARREFTTMMAKKSTIISTIIVAALIGAGMFVVNYFATRDDGSSSLTVGISEAFEAQQDAYEQAAEATGQSLDLPVLTREAAESKIEDGDLDAYLDGTPEKAELVVDEEADPAVLAIVQSVSADAALATQIEQLGGDPAEVTQALAGAAPTVTALADTADGPDAEEQGKSVFVATIVLSLVLFMLIGGGATLSMGVVEEKSSRVVEILLSTIRPAQLLAGKIIGIGLAMLVQLVVYIAVFAVVGTITGITSDMPMSTGAFLAQVLVWALLAYVMFSVVWGALASTVSRQEDVGAITTPMTFLLLAGFYLGIFLVPNSPDGTLTQVLSIVPLFSPFMMPVRLAVTSVPAWQQGVGIVLVALAAAALLWLGGKIYERGVLHSGGRMSLKEAITGKAATE